VPCGTARGFSGNGGRRQGRRAALRRPATRVVRNPRPRIRRGLPSRGTASGALPAQRLPAHRVPQAEVLLFPLRVGAFALQLFRRYRRPACRRFVIRAAACHSDNRQHQQRRSHPPPAFLNSNSADRELTDRAIIGRECGFNSQTKSSSQHVRGASAGQPTRPFHRSRAQRSAALSRGLNRRGWRSAISAIIAW
jgi:hypothetical protein